MGRLIRCITDDGCVIAMAVDTTDVVNQAVAYHGTSAVVSAALGRLLTAASMMGYSLKGEKDTLTLRMAGDGPLEAMVAVSDSHGHVKGYPVNPIVEIPLNEKGKLDVGGAIGEGKLYVMKDLGLKEPYNGVIPLVSGEVAEDITAYFAVSEQIPTVCALGVLVNPDLTAQKAGGLLIQLLPSADDAVIDKVERSVQGIAPVSISLANGESLEQILADALKEFKVEVLEEGKVEYRCDCSRKRTEKVLLTLGKDELESMAKESKPTQVCCHFCNRKYSFSPSELKKIIDENF